MKGRNTFSVLCIAKKQRMTKCGELPIFCRVTINSQRAEFSTNIRLKPSQWNDKTNQPFGRDVLGPYYLVCGKVLYKESEIQKFLEEARKQCLAEQELV